MDPAPTKISPFPLPDALPFTQRRHPVPPESRSGLQPPQPAAADDRLLAALPDPSARRAHHHRRGRARGDHRLRVDRKSTRLNSSHANISYAVFCLKKKKKTPTRILIPRLLVLRVVRLTRDILRVVLLCVPELVSTT